MLKERYNFVPLNRQIIYPKWTNRISHDIPFKDGIDGQIQILINTQSPIFVRNGAKDSSKRFSQTTDGRFFIPASSIKGVIRNVLEILTFSDISTKTDVEKARKLLKSKDSRLDFSECIFGAAQGDRKNKESLKGRVYFGHGFAINQAIELEEVTMLLSSPNPDFYPAYIYQGEEYVNLYQKYKDDSAEIAGWKRFPIRKEDKPIKHPPKQEKEEQIIKFIPLDAGVQFQSKIAFHNLRPEELGALLSALTFHHSENFYHSIGMAKPQGYGKVKIKVESLKLENKREDSVSNYLRSFEAYMQAKLSINDENRDWLKSPQLRNLAAMSQKHKEDNDNHLQYEAGPQVKKDGKALLRYPEYITNYDQFQSAFKIQENLKVNPSYIKVLKEKENELKRNREDKQRKKDNIEDALKKELRNEPKLQEFKRGDKIKAKVISSAEWKVVLLADNEELPYATITKGSKKKAEQKAGRSIELKDNDTVEVEIDSTDFTVVKFIKKL